jgi:hypothetical protein
MYLEVLNRIRAAPIEHLGCRSVIRLDAFNLGYSAVAGITKMSRLSLEPEPLVDWIRGRYGLEETTLGVFQLLRRIAQNDERAFDLFFTELDAFIGSHPDVVNMVESAALRDTFAPASSLLHGFSDRPAMYLTPVTVGGLRAAVDGYSLAAIEEGQRECADLEGFEHWVRNKFALKGYFRWENAVLAQLGGNESAAFEWAVKELKAYHANGGLRGSIRPMDEM